MSFPALDPGTLGFVLNLVVLCLTAISVMLWRTNQMYPGFGRWTAGRLIVILNILFSIQIGTWPHSIVFAAAFSLLSVTLSFEACRQFIGLKPSLRWTYVLSFLLVLHVIVAEPHPGALRLNYIEVTAALGLFHFLTAMTLLKGLPAAKTPGQIATGIVFLFRVAIDSLRCYYFLANPNARLFDSAPLNLALIIGTVLADIILNFAFFLMHYERALSEKADEISRAKKANGALIELKRGLEERVEQRTSELARSQKLEGVARLAGGVAHDFNNILTVINGYSGLLLAQLRPADPMYEAISQIAKAGSRAAGITKQLLTISRQQKTIRGFSLSMPCFWR